YSDNPNVLIKNNKITFTSDGEYIVIYEEDGEYNITFTSDKDIKLIETSFDKVLNINNRYIVNNKFRVFKFYNNKSVFEHINIDLCSELADINYHFSNICRLEEHYTIDINHKCKNTSSNIVNKSIALKNSILKFIINSNVGKQETGSVLDQSTRILAMGECDASISPNMFIDLDDVSAKHGSVIGSFKEDDVFYLMSRGISYSDAIKLLIKGYIMGNMDVDVDTRTMIMEIIDTYWR
ncbi:MAG: SufD family Fe-S cluster assembly protein, partial [Bacilli bacterium]|nr:SufD family Fe-S cluster assembly protein [Bacilli bacterium]